MNYRLNKEMLALLGGDPAFTESSSVPIPDALNRALAAGFEDINGCIVLSSLASCRSSALESLKGNDNETGIEAAINEIHMEDFIPVETPFFELVRLGNDFGFALGKRLVDTGIVERFRVIIGAMPVGSSSMRNSCTVRFHKLRRDQSWLNDDLESYQKEAIGVMDF